MLHLKNRCIFWNVRICKIQNWYTKICIFFKFLGWTLIIYLYSDYCCFYFCFYHNASTVVYFDLPQVYIKLFKWFSALNPYLLVLTFNIAYCSPVSTNTSISCLVQGLNTQWLNKLSTSKCKRQQNTTNRQLSLFKLEVNMNCIKNRK